MNPWQMPTSGVLHMYYMSLLSCRVAIGAEILPRALCICVERLISLNSLCVCSPHEDIWWHGVVAELLVHHKVDLAHLLKPKLLVSTIPHDGGFS